MTLVEVNEQLHRRREIDPLSGEELAPAKPKSKLPEPADFPVPNVPLGDAWGGDEKREEPVVAGTALHNPLRHIPRKVTLILGGLTLVLLVTGIMFKAGGWLFSANDVQVNITGPKRVESNQTVEYVIRYENNNWIDLDDAELIITYPQFFRFTGAEGFQMSATRAVLPLGTVKHSSQNTITITGSFQSLQDQVALFTATLRAAPKGIANRVDTVSQYSIAVESSVVVVELSAPLQAGDNQLVDYVATYRNESADTLENIVLLIDYPTGFTFREATPKPTRDEHVWQLPALGPGESGTVTVHGLVTGGQGDVKRVTAKVGVPQGNGSLLSYAEIDRQTRIVASPLTILQKIGDSDGQPTMAPGDTLAYRIVFRNDGDLGLRDLILTVDLDPQYFDVSRIQLGNGGKYNVATRQAIFRAADRDVLTLLDPGESGEISFSIPVRDDLPTLDLRNVEIESIARIDSPDVPTPIGANKIIASNRIALKVKTAPVLDIAGYHFDDRGNTGPMPPRVGEETTYTINLRVASTMNAIDDARIVLPVPGQVRYLKTYANDQGTVVYNDRTGEISWNIGTIAPGVTHPISLSIQIGLTPDPSQALGVVKLINAGVFTGKDAWSGDALRSDLPSKTTTLIEDKLIANGDNGKVSPAE